MKSIGFEPDKTEKDNESYKNSIEEFINNIKDNQNKIYAIRFINEIYFSNKLNQDNYGGFDEKNYNI